VVSHPPKKWSVPGLLPVGRRGAWSGAAALGAHQIALQLWMPCALALTRWRRAHRRSALGGDTRPAPGGGSGSPASAASAHAFALAVAPARSSCRSCSPQDLGRAVRRSAVLVVAMQPPAGPPAWTAFIGPATCANCATFPRAPRWAFLKPGDLVAYGLNLGLGGGAGLTLFIVVRPVGLRCGCAATGGRRRRRPDAAGRQASAGVAADVQWRVVEQLVQIDAWRGGPVDGFPSLIRSSLTNVQSMLYAYACQRPGTARASWWRRRRRPRCTR
jgi:hypothetical protein